MELRDYFKKEAEKIEKVLNNQLVSFKKGITDKKLTALFDQFILSCRGGKRIRGVLVILGNRIAGGKISEEVLKAAAAFEIFQTAICAHDDIIDESIIRRGRASLYKSTSINDAIVLADAGFFLANTLIDNPKALKIFNKAALNTCLGQLLDIIKTQTIQTHILKTAWYTFIGPLCIGAVLGGAGEKLLQDLEEFGLNLGIAYQMQDDLLDEEFKLGTAEDCKKKMLEYSLKARKMIPEITESASMSKLLEEMVEYLVKRTK